MVVDNIYQFSRDRARVEACYFSYNRAEGKDLVVLHKVISSDKMLLIPKCHCLSELLSLNLLLCNILEILDDTLGCSLPSNSGKSGLVYTISIDIPY